MMMIFYFFLFIWHIACFIMQLKVLCKEEKANNPFIINEGEKMRECSHLI